MRITLILVLWLLVACSVSESESLPGQEDYTGNGEYAYTAEEIVIEQKTVIGRPASQLQFHLFEVPEVRVYGNGRVIYRHLQPDGGFVWHETGLSATELEQLVQTLAGPNQALCQGKEIPHSTIMDAPTTTISVLVNQQFCEASADALAVASAERTFLDQATEQQYAQLQQAYQTLRQIQTNPGKSFKPQRIIIYTTGVPQAPATQLPAWTFNAPPTNDTLISGAEATSILELVAQPTIVEWNGEPLEVVAVPELP